MSQFRTPLQVDASDVSIGHHNGLVALGSCFAEHIGKRLEAYKFSVALNPFGILYNPTSIADALERLHAGSPYEAADLFSHQGLWHSFDHHGRFSFPEREQALEAINNALAAGALAIKRADRILLSFGTAGVFVVRETGRIAANCHKLPDQTFERKRMSVSEIADRLSPVFEALKTDSQGLHVLLTVSPVRHLRDGFVENQRSKATLLLATEELCRRHPFAHYFPAYELLMDDLRDYRFYGPDMVHPAPVAIDYIWAQFAGCYFHAETQRLVSAIQKIRSAVAHRPFHPASPAHRTFVAHSRREMEHLEAQYAFLDFGEEKRLIELG